MLLQKPVPNFAKGRGQYRPEIIVVHIAEGLINQAYLEFLHTEKSSHYCVANNGDVWQFVQEQDTAWANGELSHPIAKAVLAHKGVNPNLFSVSIEHEGYGTSGINEIQYHTTAQLVSDISKRWMIPLDSDHVIPHRWIKASKTCPGIVDVDRIISLAKAISNAPPVEPTPEQRQEIIVLQEKVGWLTALINKFLKK